MRLRIAIAAVVVSMFVVFSPFGTMAQTPSLSSRIVDALKAKEPNWKYFGAIESGHIRLVPSEEPIIVGGWHSPNSGYLSEYKDGHQFEIEFRKGSVVTRIAGRDLDRVKEFAQSIVEQIDPNVD